MVYDANEVHKTSKSTISKPTKKRYNYVALNMGASFDTALGLGFHLNLAELNIAAQSGWGGSLKWGAHAFPVDITTSSDYQGINTSSYSSGTLSLGYIMAGPSYSFSTRNEKIIFTPRLLIGMITPVLSSSDYGTVDRKSTRLNSSHL